MTRLFPRSLCAALALVLCAGIAAAGPPVPATYKTLSGGILPGRASESMPCDLCEGQIGNLVMSQSWDGAALGTNWMVSCPQIASPPVLIYDGVVGGNGQRIWRTEYSGGTLWLSGTGAWAGGDPQYTGPVVLFTVVVTKQYLAGQVVGAVSNINLSGTFDGYGGCYEMAISNAELVGATPGTPGEPGLFPAFQGPLDCGIAGAHGAWWDVHDITFSIIGECLVGTRSTTWGTIKSLYR